MISVICPIYNEIKYIDKIIDFCKSAKPDNKEVFLVDGGSTDGTIERIKERIQTDNRFILLNNPHKIVPYALNQAILQAKGEIIIRIDAHTDFDIDYFANILKTFQEKEADIVGGSCRIAKGTPTQEAVGYAISTAFGVGNSSNHYENFEGYTDSVVFGAWKKEIFKVTGLFDETLKRNQDDEFHYRAKSKGFKIYQSPSIKLYYHPRSKFNKLFIQYYEYGIYKPIVLKEVKSEIKLRHLIPSLFCLYLFSLIIFSIFKLYYLFVFLILYTLIDLFFCFKSKKPFAITRKIFFVYPVLHIAYGLGFILGFFKILFKLKQ